MATTVPAVCAYCGQTFNAKKVEVKRGGGKYCSIQCVGAAKRKQEK
jgi:hypothetical protein